MSIEAKYSKILSENGINAEVEEVIRKGSGGLAGEHFASVCEFVTVKFKGQSEPLNLFVKNILPCPTAKDQEMAEEMMIKEGTFLRTVVGQLSHGVSRNVEKFLSAEVAKCFPRTFWADEKEIIMEDIGSRGFRMLKKTEKHDFATAKTVMESLATFHAASLRWIKNLGGKDKVLERFPYMKEVYSSPEVEQQARESIDPSFESLLNILKISKLPESSIVYDRISKYRGKCMDTILKAVTSPNSLFDVLGHGDLWNNNMMFSESREDVIFIDFQLLRLNTPNLDIVYYLFTSVGSDARARWEELLKIYLDKLGSTIKALGETLDLTYEKFVEDFREKAPMGLVVGLFMTIGTEAMSGYEVSKTEGFNPAMFTETINKWIADNPSKTDAIIKVASSLVLDATLIFDF